MTTGSALWWFLTERDSTARLAEPGDLALASCSIDRDRQALLPFIQAALRAAGRPVRLLVSP